MSKSSNKNILITGSSNGLGYNLAKIFIDNGNKVFLNGLSKKNVSIRCKELNTEGMACDVTKENDCNKLIKSAEKYLGNIDVLVCNVGSGSSVPIGNETLKEWKRVFDLNFFSTVNTVNALIKNSKEAIDEKKQKDTNLLGKIDVEIIKNNEYIEIKMLDNGSGFKNTKDIIKPYYTTKKEGTGLGLPIVTKIINEHEGDIQFLQNTNGAEIKIYLPKI